MTDQQEVLNTVARLIREVVGEDWAQDLAISMETAFGQDLELESIEFVALAEKIQIQYGQSVDFVGWLSDKDLEAIIGLKVGDVVDFIVRCR